MPFHRFDLTPGYPVLEINHPAARARVALHGAHLMEWEPAGAPGGPVIYLSPQAIHQHGKAIRGGVPVCWPWFGPHATDPALPAHGFARTRVWELLEATASGNGARVVLLLTDDEETRRLWPHPFRLELTLTIGAALTISLHMTNTGDQPFTITGALHSYFKTGDIHQVTVEGLDGKTYRDAAADGTIRQQEGLIRFTGETDRDFLHQGPVTIRDPESGRLLTITGTGSGTTVVWNPWAAKAATMSDLPDGAWTGFVCVETANAWTDCIHIAPGAGHVLATEIVVTPLPATAHA